MSWGEAGRGFKNFLRELATRFTNGCLFSSASCLTRTLFHACCANVRGRKAGPIGSPAFVESTSGGKKAKATHPSTPNPPLQRIIQLPWCPVSFFLVGTRTTAVSRWLAFCNFWELRGNPKTTKLRHYHNWAPVSGQLFSPLNRFALWALPKINNFYSLAFNLPETGMFRELTPPPVNGKALPRLCVRSL